MKHVHKLLEKRGDIHVGEKNWVLNEALDAKKLQSGGTFRKVLARKLDAAIVPILSGVIARIDRNYNLNLIHQGDTPVVQFWLTIFRNSEVMRFHYEEFVSKEKMVENVEEDFQCQLPFSWLIKEAFDTQWDSVKSTAGE